MAPPSRVHGRGGGGSEKGRRCIKGCQASSWHHELTTCPPQTVIPTEGESKRVNGQLADGTDGSEFWRSERGTKENGGAGESKLLDGLGGRGCAYMKLPRAQERLPGPARRLSGVGSG